MQQLTSPSQQCSAIGLIVILCGSVVFIETRILAGQSGVSITAKKNSLFLQNAHSASNLTGKAVLSCGQSG